MIKTKKIVVLFDLEEEVENIVKKASMLAKAHDASMELVSIEYSSYLEDGQYFDPIQAAELRVKMIETHRLDLEAIAEPLRVEGLKVDTFATWGHPSYKFLNHRVKEPDSTLVIKSTKHHNKFARLFLSNEDWDLIRHCAAPLLLVKGRHWASKPVIVTAVDPEHVNDKPIFFDLKMVAYSQALAKACGGSVDLYHSDSIPPFMVVYTLISNQEEQKAKLEAFAKDAGIEAAHCHWTYSPIEASLPKLLENLGASVVVMGAVSRSGLDRVLIGSTAERLLDHIDRDVLIVKAD